MFSTRGFRNKGRMYPAGRPHPKRKTYGSKPKAGGKRRKSGNSTFGRSNPKARSAGAFGRRAGARSRVRGRLGSRRRSASGKYPGWFRTLTHLVSPTRVVGEYYNGLTVAVGLKDTWTHWKHLSLIDIQNVLTAAAASSSSTAPTKDALKQYLCQLTRQHSWTNNSSSAQVRLQFYSLKPRRDIPATGLAAISPSSSNAPSTGGTLNNPVLYTQGFADPALYVGPSGTAGTRVAANHVSATPFMVPALCSMFKIKPMPVKFPSGMSSSGLLLPGQCIRYEGKYRGPMLCSWNKFGLDGSVGNTIAATWECLRETPLIMVQMHGTAVHDTTPVTNINYGIGDIDYLQNFKFEIWQPVVSVPQTMTTTVPLPALTNPEQANVMVGVEQIEQDN